jgi:uncharacterized protein
MRPRLDLRRTLLASLVAVALVGCAVSDPTRYHMLASVGAGADASRPADSGPAVTIGVGPVSIPGYLDRTQLVTRGADGLEIWPYQRWAEPLDSGIAHALADDLAARVPSDRVAVFPWRGAVARSLDYQVALAVARFDGAPGQNVTLDARWRILGKDGKEVAFRRSLLTEPVSDAGISSLVSAMNRALGALGREIAAEIQSQSTKRAATRD